MPPKHPTDFTAKHGPDAKINPAIEGEIKRHLSAEKLPCAVAFQVARKLGLAPSEIGKTADLMNLRLAKCQLGLFGYTPKKKIVKSQPPTPKLKQLIIAKQKDNRLGCSAAWEIAADLNLSKMAVSGACEALNIRIKPCQLGAF